MGIAAIVISALAAVASLTMYGAAGIIDVIVLVVNVIVFIKMTHKDSDEF